MQHHRALTDQAPVDADTPLLALTDTLAMIIADVPALPIVDDASDGSHQKTMASKDYGMGGLLVRFQDEMIDHMKAN